MKIARYALILGLLTACAPTQHYGQQIYHRPKGSTAPPYVITGRVDVEPILGIKKTLHVSVNETEVISGDLSPTGTGAFVGKYEGHTINSSCNGYVCDVFVDGEKAGSF